MWVFSAKVREHRHCSGHTIACKRASLERHLLKNWGSQHFWRNVFCWLSATPTCCTGQELQTTAVIGYFPERLGLVQWRYWEVVPETAKSRRTRGSVSTLRGPCQGPGLEEPKSGSSALNTAPGKSAGRPPGWLPKWMEVKGRVGGDAGRPRRSPVPLALGHQVGFPKQV